MINNMYTFGLVRSSQPLQSAHASTGTIDDFPPPRKEIVVVAKENAGPLANFSGSDAPLSFFQRHFCRFSNAETDDRQPPQSAHFSLLARGSIITFGLLLLLVVIIVLCAVLATVFYHNHKQKSPVKEAVLANFPDPAIIKHEGIWYAFATNNAAGILSQPANSTLPDYGVSNVQMATSLDFDTWTLLNSTSDPLRSLGAWVNLNYTKTDPPVPKANVWAPEVLQRPSDGKFVMWYSAATGNATRSHCIGAAVSDTGPGGPYMPLDEPFTCPTFAGGAIDPVPFIDVDGTIYVAWKVDGNNAGHGGMKKALYT